MLTSYVPCRYPYPADKPAKGGPPALHKSRAAKRGQGLISHHIHCDARRLSLSYAIIVGTGNLELVGWKHEKVQLRPNRTRKKEKEVIVTYDIHM